MHRLKLRNNGLQEGMEQVAAALASDTALKHIDLSWNYLRMNSAIHILQALMVCSILNITIKILNTIKE